MLIPLGNIAAPGAALTTLMLKLPVPLDAGEAKWPARPPTRAATSRSESRVDHSARPFAREVAAGISSGACALESGAESWSLPCGAYGSSLSRSMGLVQFTVVASMAGSDRTDDGVEAMCASDISAVVPSMISSDDSVGESLTMPC